LCDTDVQDIIRLLEEKGVNIELKRVPREKAVNIRDALKEFCDVI
jgi:mannose/fructose/N-acetylgalactosamine-specific phosphotransferase system component IIB